MTISNSSTKPAGLKFTQVYRMPGEGLIAEFRDFGATMLFDADGLRYKVLQLRSQGKDASEEEKALAILQSLDGG